MTDDETYNGWTNWETWNVALMLNNEQELQRQALDSVRFEMPAKFQDFAIRTVIANHNSVQLENAEDWNSIPMDERPGDTEWERKDVEPWLIDESKVNWDEIIESFREHLRECDYQY